MSDSKNALDKFEARVSSEERLESIAVKGLRPILFGAADFKKSLDLQINLLDALREQLLRLEDNGNASGTLVKYESQRGELSTARGDLAILKDRAEQILKLATGADKSFYGAKQIDDIWSRHIHPLLHEEQMRKYRALRIQGPMVEEQRFEGEKCNGMIAEAVVEMVKYITHVLSDPQSGLRSLWRWMGQDGSIWLYHHSDHEKWKCMFFRIHVSRIYDNLSFSMESYVPFGFGNDPAHYEMETSEVYLRPGWRTAEISSASYSTMNTFNLQSSITHTDGVSLGTSVSTNFSTNESTTTGTSETVSHSTNQSVTNTDSWFSNWSETMGSSTSHSGLGVGAGGGATYGSSYGQSYGGGTSGSRSDTYGTSDGISTGTSQSHNKGTSQGESYSTQEGEQHSEARTTGVGIARSAGETLQVKVMGYGINLGKKSLEHLEKWKEANRDAARVYDNVQYLFKAMCKEIKERLQALGTGAGAYDEGKLESRLPEIEPFFLVERQMLPGKDAGAIATSSQPGLTEPVRSLGDVSGTTGSQNEAKWKG
jgi:hypothetical protein